MADFGIIKTGGKQYKVKVGDTLEVEKLAEKKKIEFKDILGNKKVTATVISDIKSPKVMIVKFKAKKRYKRNRGHRQIKTLIKIESIA